MGVPVISRHRCRHLDTLHICTAAAAHHLAVLDSSKRSTIWRRKLKTYGGDRFRPIVRDGLRLRADRLEEHPIKVRGQRDPIRF